MSVLAAVCNSRIVLELDPLLVRDTKIFPDHLFIDVLLLLVTLVRELL